MAEYTWKDYYARALALAESLVDVASEEPPPSDAALRDEVCMAHAVVAADIIIERLERERDDAVRFRDEWQRVYFELIKAIGSSPASSKPPVSVALELRAKLDTLTKELEAARKEANVAAKKIVAALDKRWPNLNIEGWDNEEAADIVAAALKEPQ